MCNPATTRPKRKLRVPKWKSFDPGAKSADETAASHRRAASAMKGHARSLSRAMAEGATKERKRLKKSFGTIVADNCRLKRESAGLRHDNRHLRAKRSPPKSVADGVAFTKGRPSSTTSRFSTHRRTVMRTLCVVPGPFGGRFGWAAGRSGNYCTDVTDCGHTSSVMSYGGATIAVFNGGIDVRQVGG